MSKVKGCVFFKKKIKCLRPLVSKSVKINIFLCLRVPDTIVHKMSGVGKITKIRALYEKTVSMVTTSFTKLANLH